MTPSSLVELVTVIGANCVTEERVGTAEYKPLGDTHFKKLPVALHGGVVVNEQEIAEFISDLEPSLIVIKTDNSLYTTLKDKNGAYWNITAEINHLLRHES